jgi:hypothetical protein
MKIVFLHKTCVPVSRAYDRTDALFSMRLKQRFYILHCVSYTLLTNIIFFRLLTPVEVICETYICDCNVCSHIIEKKIH